jgi:hypothetical protein
MKGDDDHPARGQNPAPPNRPRRVWDGSTGTWIEPHVRRRNLLGRWSRLLGTEPAAQLVFDFAKRIG